MRVLFNDVNGNMTVQEFDYCTAIQRFSDCIATEHPCNLGGLYLSSAADLSAGLEPTLIPMDFLSAQNQLAVLTSKGFVNLCGMQAISVAEIRGGVKRK